MINYNFVVIVAGFTLLEERFSYSLASFSTHTTNKNVTNEKYINGSAQLCSLVRSVYVWFFARETMLFPGAFDLAEAILLGLPVYGWLGMLTYDFIYRNDITPSPLVPPLTWCVYSEYVSSILGTAKVDNSTSIVCFVAKYMGSI